MKKVVDRECLYIALRYARKNFLYDGTPEKGEYIVDEDDAELIADLLEAHFNEREVE